MTAATDGWLTFEAFFDHSAGDVDLQVFDAAGRCVRELTTPGQDFAAGGHRLVWDGRDASGRRLAQGVYVVRLTAGDETTGRKLVMLE